MSDISESVVELIGKTPMLRLHRYENEKKAQAELYAKLEYLNPAGSVKDRVGLAMIEDAEKRGILKAGGTIIEPTSGNTGIGLAAVAAVRGYQVIITLPETMSVERRTLLRAYGAKLVLTDGAKGMTGAIEKAKELQTQIPGSVILGSLTIRQTPGPTMRRPDRKFLRRWTEISISSWPAWAPAEPSPVWADI